MNLRRLIITAEGIYYNSNIRDFIIKANYCEGLPLPLYFSVQVALSLCICSRAVANS